MQESTAVLPTVSVSASATDITIPGSATLTATAENATAYKWQRSANLTVWEDITGETSETCTVSYFAAEDAGTKYYRCVVSNDDGMAESNVIILIVATAPEPDPQPSVTVTTSAAAITAPGPQPCSQPQNTLPGISGRV